MNRHMSRLKKVAQSLGCQLHEESLVCLRCEPPEPYPEPVATGMDTLIEAIIDRVGREGIKAAALRVGRPPLQEPCARCGTRRKCMRCQVRQGHALLHHISATGMDGLRYGIPIKWAMYF